MEIFNDILNWCGEQITALLSWIVFFLPDSPFKLLDSTPLQPYLSTINYFIPLDFILSVTSAWLSVILVYYSYSVIMRWIKLIQ